MKMKRIIIGTLQIKCYFSDRYNSIPFANYVFSFVKQYDHLFLKSYFKHFPNAVLESCFVGTPVIAFKGPRGIKEIIENGINGYIVEDESEFIQKQLTYCFRRNGIPLTSKIQLLKNSTSYPRTIRTIIH